MPPKNFQYYAPSSLEEATTLLQEHEGDVKVIAGGMSLVPLMKLRLSSPGHLVDINRLAGLSYIRESDDGKSLLIGSLTTHHELESSELVKRRVPLLSETAALIGDPQVRNRGTIGGALAHSDPSGDWGAAVLALRGQLGVFARSGERRISVDDLLVDTFATSLKADEIITQVSIPFPAGPSGSSYQKLERKAGSAGDFATAGVAAQLSVERRRDGDYCTYAGIGLTALGPKNLRAGNAEALLLGRLLTKETILAASAAAEKECAPTDDPLRGPAGYKRRMAGVLTRRALEIAAKRAGGS